MNSPNGAVPVVSPTDKPPRGGPTEFLPDIRPASWRAWLYLLVRSQALGLTLNRWLYLGLVVIAIVWSLAPLPGGWVVGLVWIVLLLGLWVTIRLARQRDFSAFEREELMLPPSQIMPPADKLPVYVTGTLSVEQKVSAFTNVPGFYRSFATREHALLCRVRERRILAVASWPGEEIGLWYAFFMPDQLTSIEQGRLEVGSQKLPALAVTYRPSMHTSRRRSQPASTVLYLAFLNQADFATVLADLTVEWRPSP